MSETRLDKTAGLVDRTSGMVSMKVSIRLEALMSTLRPMAPLIMLGAGSVLPVLVPVAYGQV